MTLFEKTFRDMQRNSISYIRTNESLWTAQPAIKANILLLEKNYSDLEASIATQQSNDPSGYVDQKNDLAENLLSRCYALDCKLSFYAKDKNDKVLLNDVNYIYRIIKSDIIQLFYRMLGLQSDFLLRSNISQLFQIKRFELLLFANTTSAFLLD